MGLRFRKSLKIASGVKVNIGKHGVSSVSFGNFNIGSRGIYHTASIPGTGISYRSRVVGPPKQKAGLSQSRKKAKATEISITLRLQDDGSVDYLDAKGQPLPDQAIRVVQKQNRGLILEWLQQQCDKYNSEIEALINIHWTTPAPTGEIVVNPKPEPPKIEPYGPLSRLFAGQRQKVDERNRRAQEAYEKALLEWEKAEQALRSDVEVMSAVLSSALTSIEWPWETVVSFDIRDSGSTVLLDVDLPEIEDMPTGRAQVRQRDLRLIIEERSQSQIQFEYVTHIHAIGFRLIGEVFARLPSVSTVVCSGYSQRVNKNTGRIEDQYLYSVRVPRAMWEQIDFGNLRAIDVITCFERFQIRRNITKRGVISPIEPFTE